MTPKPLPDRHHPTQRARRAPAWLGLALVQLLLVGSLLLATSGSHAQAQPQAQAQAGTGTDAAEDLLSIYGQARLSDPVLAAAAAARGVVQEGVAQARAPLLPQWSLGWTYAQSRSNAGDGLLGSGADRSRELSSRLSQVLLDLNQAAQLKSAQARAEAQDAIFQAAQQDLSVRVASAYFEVLTAIDTLANVQANEDAFRQQVEQSQARFATGLAAQVDVEQARTFLALARSSTISARQSLADAREALAEITGRAAGTLKVLTEDLPALPPEPADPQHWVGAALAGNPLLRAQAQTLLASERSLDAARAAHLPTVSLGLDVGRNGQWPSTASSGVNDGRNTATLGVTVSLPLSSGGATESLRRQAVYQREGAREDLEQRRRRVARDTLDHYRNVLAQIEQIASNRAAVDAARKSLTATRAGQDLGTRTMSDLLQAIQTLATAQNAYSRARHQYILGKLLLQQDLGAVGEAELAAVNALLR